MEDPAPQQPANAAASPAEDLLPPPFPNNIEHPVYQNVSTILAPMVRASTLPLRQLSFELGADLCYNEEIIDKRLVHARRFRNPHYPDVIEYYVGLPPAGVYGGGAGGQPQNSEQGGGAGTGGKTPAAEAGAPTPVASKKSDCNNGGDRKSVFRTTRREILANRTIFQLGTACPELALQAARIVIDDVAGVDVNMGCPKSFSVKGGMGAALLACPDKAAAIVKNLRDHLPLCKSVTCKIRMNEDLCVTRDYMLKMREAGADAVAVHMRLVGDRPRHPAKWPQFKELLSLLPPHFPVIANGDFLSEAGIAHFRTNHPTVPLMLARGAQWHPALFQYEKMLRRAGSVLTGGGPLGRGGPACSSLLPDRDDIHRRYLQKCIDCGAIFQEVKWNMQENAAKDGTVNGRTLKQFNAALQKTRCMQDIVDLVNTAGAGAAAHPKIRYDQQQHPEKAHTIAYAKEVLYNHFFGELLLENGAGKTSGEEVVSEPASKKRRISPRPSSGGDQVSLDERSGAT